MFLLSRSVKNITASWTALEEEKDDVEEEVVDRFRGRGAWRCLRVVLVLMPMSYVATQKENSPNSRVMKANMVS